MVHLYGTAFFFYFILESYEGLGEGKKVVKVTNENAFSIDVICLD